MKKLRFKNRNGILYFGVGDKFKSSKLKYSNVNKNIIISKFKNGALNEDLEVIQIKSPTVESYLERVILEKKKNVRQSTLKAYKSSFTRISKYFDGKMTKEVKPIHIKNFLESIADDKEARTLLSRVKFLLKEIFDLSVLNEDIVSNPVNVVRSPKNKS